MFPLAYPPEGLYLSVGLSAAQSFEAIDRAGRIDLLIVAAGALATFAATAFVGWRAFLRPLQSLTEVLRRWRDGERDARTGHTADESEIAQLGATLDGLFDQLTKAQADRDLVSHEMAHRVKNTLATVQAIASQTLNKTAPANELLPAYQSRIAALAQTHEVLLRERWEAADLEGIVRAVVSALCDDVDARFRIDGPTRRTAAARGLGDDAGHPRTLHERAEIWRARRRRLHRRRLDGDARRRPGRTLNLVWRETNGGATDAPTPLGKGFGTRLLAVAFGASGSTRLRREPAGVVCAIEVFLDNAPQAT